MSPRKWTRREILRAGAGALLPSALLVGGCPSALPGLTPVTSDGNSLLPGGVPLKDSPCPIETPAQVAAARGRDLADMVRRVLDAIGGIASVVKPGESVFIKPNFLTAGLNRSSYTTTGEITKVEVVIAIAEECLRAGAAMVTIGDGAQVHQYSFQSLKTLDGSTNLAAEADRLNADYGDRLQLACLNRDTPEWDALPSPRTSLGTILASSLVTRADKIISVPVLKTHHIAHVSLSMKNFMGVPPIEKYGGGSEQVGRHRLHGTNGGPEGSFLDLVAGLRPHLAIIDASIGVEGSGPWVHSDEGRTVDMRSRLGDWLMLASTDLVAADVTAARIIGQEYTSIPYMVSAYQQGLGQAQADLISVVGENLEDLFVPWKPAKLMR